MRRLATPRDTTTTPLVNIVHLVIQTAWIRIRRQLNMSRMRLVLTVVVVVLGGGSAADANDSPTGLLVDPRSDGTIQATASFRVKADPSDIQAVITDYEQWPDLFDTDIRITKVERLEGRVVTELLVNHMLLFSSKRLLCENREIPGGGLTTSKLEGDFKRYDRTWKVLPKKEGDYSVVEFHLEMDVNTWAPDWIVASALRDELEVHFQLVKERAEEIAAARSGRKGELH